MKVQYWAMGALALALILMLPFAQPIDLYYALNPAGQTMRLNALSLANMTNRAILAWSVDSITEVMTIGFGDLDVKLPQQRYRFTGDGWDAFVKAFREQGIGKQFKQNQLVLTTVPSNTPVILSQGVNDDQRYQWVVQMPVVMTYATNNNVTSRKNGLVTLVIVRDNTTQNPTGIAIESWIMETR